MSTIADKLAAGLARRVHASGQDRLDLSLQDFSIARDKQSARLLIGFDRRQKAPTPSAIARFVQARFPGTLDAELSTAVEHADINAVSVIASVKTPTRRIEDLGLSLPGNPNAKQFLPVIANTLYLDQTINANWEVRTNPETGAKYLAQVRAEDIAGLLDSVRVKHATASFSSLQTAAASILPEVGDYVEFFADQGLRNGDVSKINGDDVVVVDEGGVTYIVERQNITRMLRKNPKSLTKQEAGLIEALTPAMGDRKLAEELVRGNRAGRR